MRTTSPEILGREPELALLRTLLVSAADHQGGTVLLSGEAGIGKSRLADACAVEAYERDMPVLRGRASASHLVVPFRPLTEALASRFRSAGVPADPELAPYRPPLGALVPEWRHTVPDGHRGSLIELAEALLRLLAVLGRDHGCLLVLEDLHDADTETLAVVEYVMDNLAGLPVLLVVTLRPGKGAASDLVLAAERRRTAVPRELGPLREVDVRAMADICLGAGPGDVPEAAHRSLARRTGGNPYLVEMLLSDLLATGRLRRERGVWRFDERQEASVPSGLVRSWARRLDQYDETLRELLVTAAVLGVRFSVSALKTVTGLADRPLFAHLRTAMEAGVITPDAAADYYAFRHTLTAEALAASLPPPERADLARRIAQVVEDNARALAPVLKDWRQLVAALRLTAGDQAAAARQFAQAGREILASGACGSAVVLLERARRLATGPDRDSVTVWLALAHAQAGALDEACSLLDGLPPASPGTPEAAERAQAHAQTAWIALQTEDRARATRQLLAARTLLGPAPGLEQEVSLAVVEAHLPLVPETAAEIHPPQDHPVLPGPAEAEASARRAAQLAEERGLPELACQAWQLLALLARERGFDEADDCLRNMLSVAERGGLARWRAEALTRLGANAYLRSGEATLLESARTAAGELGALVLTQTVDALLAMRAALRGQWEEAAGIVACREESSARLGDHAVHRYLLLVGAIVAAHRGRSAECEQALLRFRRAGGEESVLRPVQLGLCLAVGALLEEDRERAAAHLDAALEWERDRPTYYYLGGRHGLRPLLRVLARQDGREIHRAALRSPGATLAWNRLFLQLADAVLLGQEGDRDGAARTVRAAVWAADLFPVAWHLGLRLTAEAALADGWGDPLSWLRTAEEFFHSEKVAPAAAACRAALRRAGASVPQRRDGRALIPAPLRAGGVTPREYEVFVLLAARPGNQEIARRLSISPRTVEKHVAGLLAKTGCPDRAALCRLSAEYAQDT